MFGRNEQLGRTSLKLMAGCLLTLTAVSAATAQGSRSVLKVVPQGTDGVEAYYTLTCEDGHRGDITVNVETDMICAQRYDRPAICKISVPIMQAAESVCKG